MNGIMSVAVIFSVFAVGFLFSVKKYWQPNTPSVLSVIVVKIATPALALISIHDRFTPELLRQSFYFILIITLYMTFIFLTGKACAKILRIPKGKCQVFELSFVFSNIIFIGLPINQIMFGSEGLPYLFTFYFVSITMFWSVGAYKLAKASPSAEKTFSFKKIINPAFVGIITGCLLVETRLDIPYVFDQVIRYLAALGVPLALLVVGANLAGLAKSVPKISKDEWVILASKFIICPLFMFILLRLFGVSGLAFKVFILTSSMPCHMQTSILAEYYEVESAYASKLVSVSTLFSLITIPVYTTLLNG
jgi:predicted permease